MAVAVLIEALVTYGHEVVKNPTLIITIVVGVALSFIFDAAIFSTIGIEINHYADIVLSGILMSRGSNYVYDLIGHLTAKQPVK